ncbi:MAG: DUF58 domain-containing protein [Planctomycetes bacterium]|nr:DUF58 domain-containing protein [Planctomycetota bacterium]
MPADLRERLYDYLEKPSPGWRLGARAFLRYLGRIWRDDLTPPGRALLCGCAIGAIAGLDTTSSLIYILFAIMFSMLAVAGAAGWFLRPRRLGIRRDAPERTTAGEPFLIRYEIENPGPRPCYDLWVGERACPPALAPVGGGSPAVPLSLLKPETRAEVSLSLVAPRRGAYMLKSATVDTTFPFGLTRLGQRGARPHRILVYPRFSALGRLIVPVGRKYQPGGIPLASSTGDSTEFVGVREYRAGDPLRKIDWRSWGRHGKPVVKEYQEEYFCRIALVLDTYLGQPGKEGLEREDFEAGISFAASVADYFSREEYIINLFAAGSELFHLEAGRHLGFLENILDVLACVEPCSSVPFPHLGLELQARLESVSTTVVVLLDFDRPRIEFLRAIAAAGTGLKVVVVKSRPTPEDPRLYTAEFGEVSVLEAKSAREPPGVL